MTKRNARKHYPSDLTDLQWDDIEHLFRRPRRGKGGRPRTYDLRDVVNALFYLARAGCSWRLLPHDFQPWGLVRYYFYTWRDRGLIEQIHAVLRVDLRQLDGRGPTPAATASDFPQHDISTWWVTPEDLTCKGVSLTLDLPNKTRQNFRRRPLVS